MKREIKFRVYDSDENIMKPVLYLKNKRECITEDGERYVNCPIVQFTGLKDKNGVEIYEGDILKGSKQSPYSRKSPVVNDIVVWKDNGWKRECYNGEMKVYPNINVIEMEIIGNIHQNPELLK